MKKRIIGLTLAGVVALGGIVSAASMWGTYKGNDIIRLTVDGSPVKVADVPAISYNNRTMIPINLLQQAGVKYSWDQKNKTVDIKANESAANNTSDTDVETLKDLAKLSDFYHKLDSLGSMISSTGEKLSFAFEAKNMNRLNGELDAAFDRLNDNINSYNDFLNFANNVESQISNSGIGIGPGRNALKSYYDALDYYKASYAGLERYYVSAAQSDFNTYLNNSSKGFDAVASGRQTAITNYNTVVIRISNY